MKFGLLDRFFGQKRRDCEPIDRVKHAEERRRNVDDLQAAELETRARERLLEDYERDLRLTRLLQQQDEGRNHDSD